MIDYHCDNRCVYMDSSMPVWSGFRILSFSFFGVVHLDIIFGFQKPHEPLKGSCWKKTWDCGMRTPNPGYRQLLSTCTASAASGRWQTQNKHLNSPANEELIPVLVHCRGLLAFKGAKPRDKPQSFSHNSKLLQSAVIRYQDTSNYRLWKTMVFFCVRVKAMIKPMKKKLKAMQIYPLTALK